MDSSSPPHHLESLNQEGTAAVMASEGVVRTEEAPSTTSLLDLPDELLVHVFDQLWQALRSAKESSPIGIPVPLRQILISKRIFSLARPLWFRHLIMPSDGDDLDRYLGQILKRPDIYHFIQSLRTEHPYAFPYVHATVVGLLTNLSSLTISFREASAAYGIDIPYPEELISTVGRLIYLRHVRIVGFDDQEPFLASQLPSLAHLDVEDAQLLEFYLDTSRPGLAELTLRTGTPGAADIPWETIRTLRLAPRGGSAVENPQLLLSQLELDLGKTLPLRYLILNFTCTQTGFTQGVHGSCFNASHLRNMLDLLQQAQLERLDLGYVYSLDWSPSEIKLFSGRFPALYSFLAMFPSMYHLLIEGFTFSDEEPQSAEAFSALSTVSLAVQHPAFSAFLVVLTASSVCDFRFRAMGETKELRYTRASSEDKFEAECWTLE
ncbi:hypothetical protein JCM11251_006302 [Rhodosporidiobolus azoricus]